MISVAPAVFGVALVAGSTLGGRLTDRFGAFPVVVIGLAALTPAKLAVSFATACAAGLAACATIGVAALHHVTPEDRPQKCDRGQTPKPLAGELFRGPGGSSLGLTEAGFGVVLAVGHDDEALETHGAQHPGQLGPLRRRRAGG